MILKGGAAAGAVSVAVGAGLLTPSAVLAAWNEAAFKAKDVNGALSAMIGSADTEASADITIKAPPIAENGAVVPVTVESTIAGAESITLLVEKNGTPLAASFTLGESAIPYVSTRIKMDKTSDVVAVVKAGGKSYVARKEVKVTIGGCGG
ncbi:thiosulfate oxidation carrier protein SoxY [Endothiovibrio diazotrophicus]